MMRASSPERMTSWLGNSNEAGSCFGDGLVLKAFESVPAIETTKKDRRIRKHPQGSLASILQACCRTVRRRDEISHPTTAVAGVAVVVGLNDYLVLAIPSPTPNLGHYTHSSACYREAARQAG
jgi:hypothetical protein